LYIQAIGQVDVCEAVEQPATSHRASVPQGALVPDTSYDLLVSRSAPLGGLTITLYRFKTAPQHAIMPDPIEQVFDASHGRGL
jgi:hypothetical protein